MATNVLPAVHLVLGAGGALEIADSDLLMAKQTSPRCDHGRPSPSHYRTLSRTVGSKLSTFQNNLERWSRPPTAQLCFPEQWDGNEEVRVRDVKWRSFWVNLNGTKVFPISLESHLLTRLQWDVPQPATRGPSWVFFGSDLGAWMKFSLLYSGSRLSMYSCNNLVILFYFLKKKSQFILCFLYKLGIR